MTNRYDLVGRIKFSMSGTMAAPITPERANPLIAKLTAQLRDYVFEGNGIKAVLIDLDDFWKAWWNKYFLEAGWSIAHFDVIDTSPSDDIRCQNFNNYIRGAIARDLLKMELRHYKTELKLTGITIP